LFRDQSLACMTNTYNMHFMRAIAEFPASADTATRRYRPRSQFAENDEVMPGIRYGRPDHLLTPAYWAVRCETVDLNEIDFVNRHGTLADEVGFCLLGGFGVTLEVATAFFERLRDAGVFEVGRLASEQELLRLLMQPAIVMGRPHRYRFPNQRARRIHGAMKALSELDLDPQDPIGFRGAIQSLEGVGPKTASWIVRNWLDIDTIAILDIHVLRAGWVINLFPRDCRLPNDYLTLENQFIIFAQNLNLRASVLDSVIWSDMRKFGSSMVLDRLSN
jgi:N-glycosylase/DNA lyase